MLAALASGEAQTRTWVEWMAADTAAVARNFARNCSNSFLSAALIDATALAKERGILDRLRLFGRAVGSAFADFDDPAFGEVANHNSDLVRQWCPYAVNDPARPLSLAERLRLTMRFAVDDHMTVRECAWMAFRPHLTTHLDLGLELLAELVRSTDPKARRFAVEVSRPRSVWGAHIEPLKRDPAKASAILEPVSSDQSRYVRLAVGNWLNDASKSRPDWVRGICARWIAGEDQNTRSIVRRALRTLERMAQAPSDDKSGREQSFSRLGESIC